ncbi:MAG: carboxypeptidase regulatory-like domain-containing protein [Polyangiaceae bacterium]|nr:carboxypeptidase regulatory-like domain-containing protein [Polyangiaceae bacterium]
MKFARRSEERSRTARCAWVVALLLAAPACSDDSAATGDAGGHASGGGGVGGANASSTATSTTGIDLTTSTGTGLPETFTITGVVVDQTNAPVAGAIVMQGGGEPDVTTGEDGTFEIEMTTAIIGTPTVVAAKIGYRAAGIELTSLPSEPMTLQLFAVAPPDNVGYEFMSPGVGDPDIDSSTKVCGHCHTTFTAQFQTSAHARSARDPILHDLYAGVSSSFGTAAECAAAGGVYRAGSVPGSPGNSQMRCYVGSGVLADLNDCGDSPGLSCDDPALPAASAPTMFGACADCHAIAMNGPAGGRNLLEAEGNAFDNGNSCDACHHVRDIDLDAPPGTGGRLVMQRPRETLDGQIGSPIRQAMFGPLPDVPNSIMGGSYQPKFSTAEFCAGCHDQKQEALVPGSTLSDRFADGLPTHSTFTEWSEGPFAQLGTQCQSCHMPPVDGMFNSVDTSSPTLAGLVGGFQRTPEQTRSHTFRGPLTEIPGVPRLLDGAATATITASPIAGGVDIAVAVKNVGCGHALPTGEPLRSMVLLVEADGCGDPLVPIGGMTIPDFGGASARGIVGADVTLSASTATWPAGAAIANVGDVVRIVRPTGSYWDYDGIGLFEGATLTPEEKGIEVLSPVGEASVVAVVGSQIELSASVAVAPGDIVYLADASPTDFVDGETSHRLAGAPGMAFARVMVDATGARGVPHYRAVDIASDNRIAPQRELVTAHRFAVPPGCTDVTARAIVLYRPLPTDLAKERGWDARDHVVTESMEAITLP